MPFKMKKGSPMERNFGISPAKDTMKFSENTSPGEIDAVKKHNKAHQQGVPADHSKGLVVDKIGDINKRNRRKKGAAGITMQD